MQRLIIQVWRTFLEVGTVAEIMQLLKLPDGIVKILVEGTAQLKCRNTPKVKSITEPRWKFSRMRKKKSSNASIDEERCAQFEQYIDLLKMSSRNHQRNNSVESPGRLART